MENKDKNIEAVLKNKFSTITPSKDLFEKTLKGVTKEDLNRNTIMKADIPSPYKFDFTVVVKKITYIGIPLLALSSYLIFLNINKSDTIKIQNYNPVVAENIDMPASDVIKIAEVKEEFTPENQSVDSLISDIISDTDSEADLALNDSADDAFIQSELNKYNSIKSNTYEEII